MQKLAIRVSMTFFFVLVILVVILLTVIFACGNGMLKVETTTAQENITDVHKYIQVIDPALIFLNKTRHWKYHLKNDRRSDQDHRLKLDRRSDQDHPF
jgi:hypothetical protein